MGPSSLEELKQEAKQSRRDKKKGLKVRKMQ